MSPGGTAPALAPALAWAAIDGARAALAFAVLGRGRASAPPGGEERRRSVAVLQAVRGGDPSLAESLAENLARLGPRVELWWLLDEDDPTGAAAARAARARSPEIPVRIETSPPCPPGTNPKLFKLESARRASAADVLVVLDDDARLPPASLDALLAALPEEPSEPVVSTALPAYLPGLGLGSRLLAAFVNDNAALTYLPLLAWRPALTLNGMAWAVRSADAAALGGFEPLLHRLADDLAVAQAVLARGGRIVQIPAPVWMRTELSGPGAFLRQMHRWMLFATLLLRAQAPRTRLAIVLLQGLPIALPPLAAAAFAVRPTPAVGLTFLGAFALHAALRSALNRARLGRSVATSPLASLGVALTLPLFLLWASVDRRIRWRDRRYRVLSNERFEPA